MRRRGAHTKAAGSALTGRTGAVHARGPAARAGEAALRARICARGWGLRSVRGRSQGRGLRSRPGSPLAPGRGATSSSRPAAGQRSRMLLQLRAAALPHRLRPCARGGRGIRLPAPGRRGGAGPGTPTCPRARARPPAGQPPGPRRPTAALMLPLRMLLLAPEDLWNAPRGCWPRMVCYPPCKPGLAILVCPPGKAASSKTRSVQEDTLSCKPIRFKPVHDDVPRPIKGKTEKGWS